MWACCRAFRRGCPAQPEARRTTLAADLGRSSGQQLRQVFGGQCLDGGGGQLHVWGCGENPSQKWSFFPHSGHVLNRQRSLCLDIYTREELGSQHTKPFLNPCLWKSRSQTWDFVEVAEQQYIVKHRATSLCLKVKESIIVALVACDASPTLRWRLSSPSALTRPASSEIAEWRALNLPNAYECTEGSALWRDGWSSEQKSWCCHWTQYDQDNWPANQRAFCNQLSLYRQA